jgi:nucleoside-diphosphate-sugar epimerase
VTEARGSDYLGAGSRSMMTALALPDALAGKRALVPADLDAPHSFTYVGDVARTLVALGGDQRAWGRAWHVPTAPAVSVREATTRACELVGVPAPRLARMPDAMLWLGGLFSAQAREFRKVAYQWRRPFVLDSADATATFGITATPLDDALAETAKSLQPRSLRP